MIKNMLTCALIATMLLAGCGGQRQELQVSQEVMEFREEISEDDERDPQHGDLVYDSWEFHASLLDSVALEVETESFQPLLKLVEGSTGAVLAEWDPEYSDACGLEYVIASDGDYMARVYSMDGSTGPYSIRIEISGR